MTTADLQRKTTNLADLQAEFHEAMGDVLRTSAEVDPFTVYSIKRLEKESGLLVAKRLLSERGQPTGLLRLWKNDRLALSVEVLVLRPEFRVLFSDDELREASKRLVALGYETD